MSNSLPGAGIQLSPATEVSGRVVGGDFFDSFDEGQAALEIVTPREYA